MNAMGISLIVFAVVFGGALLGMWSGRILPEEHLTSDAKDVVKVAMAMIATLAALVLGLLTASAKTSFDEKATQVRNWGAEVVLLDRTLAEYGAEAAPVRGEVKQTLVERIEQIWPGEGKTVATEAIARGPGIEDIQKQILALKPGDDAQKWLQSTALQITGTMAQARWTGLQQLQSSIQWPFMVVLVFWLALIFASFGLFAPRTGIVTLALLLAALSVAGSVYLILEMDQPYSGLIKISPQPLLTALDQLGKP